ncbi:hypothetical protein C2G38_2224045 [Gigaspora rosea]|uniref:Uncharacterized protein n=1 Tax=Gigaspora rosea TaxID=44941 RepID=A0A397U9L4_9GLOM|nr:hypothetical protein C2G38_2224045 [Gigaspora rosea]
MCTNSTKKLIINKQLVLQQPEIFFEKYARNQKYEIYINEREIIHIIKTNNNIVIDIFRKCVLKRYLKEKKKQSRFNTCLKCGKFTYITILEKFEFGKFQLLKNMKKALPNKLINENTNSCEEPNHPFTNFLQENEKVELRFPNLKKMKLFFKTYIDWRRYKLYECEHKNITVYDKKFRKIDQFVKKDLFYYVNYFLKEEMIFNTCPDCSKICVNKKNGCGCKKIKCSYE